uniref:FMN hydrolase uracil phosphatase) n=1 Tax=uncultured Thiotrichaceae bacterium TaxID=298394 RepID=A0A6S6UMN9_9GAMM|nr:MAG: Putative FMN hydrolase (EC; 5-Amino-6-(5'-phosphoribitylamino)uracil phosphatase [uncultured Thiotrichaceae bacterium]
MSIRCVCFDLDDTLWDCKLVITHAEQQLYYWLEGHQPAISQCYTSEALLASRVLYTRQHPELRHDLGELRKQWLRSLAAEAGLDTDWIDLAFQHFLKARNEVEFFPDVLAQLHLLKRDYMLGSITNGNADIKSVGLGELFDFSHNSATAGVSKPEPAIFEQALEMAGLEPHQMVYVGDDQTLDIMGANRAGLRTIWYNPSRKEFVGKVNPDATMVSFAELVKLVRSL